MAILDIFRISDDVTEITAEMLKKYITQHESKVDSKYQPLWDAYVNDYDIFHKKPKARWKPDKRLSVNFAKSMVDTFEGFFLGIPVKTTTSNPSVADYVGFVNSYNDQDSGDAELSRLVSIFGRAYELYYTDEAGVECIVHLDPIEAFMIYDESIKPRPRYFVRMYRRTSDQRIYGSISDSEGVRYFSLSSEDFWETDWEPHGFSDVPAAEFILNEARRGLYEDVLNDINEYNEILSEKANDVSYFADAYMKVLGATIDEATMNYMRDNRIINFEARSCNDVDIDFLKKPDGDATQEHLLDRLEKKIYTVSNVINMDDDHVFGTTSGQALKYKLLDMMNLFTGKARFFSAGMHRRYKVLFGNPVARMSDDAWATLKFEFTPNTPSDLSEELDAASKAGTLVNSGLLSHYTMLKYLSAVDSASEELKRIAEEKAAEDGYETERETKRTSKTPVEVEDGDSGGSEEA